MGVLELGRIEQVDIRKIWLDEARDFTPWLAKNLSLLSEVLGMDLEQVRQEAPVGRYYLDILAKDRAGRRVVIENQLEETNHDHLGKLLTYAARYDARVVIWVTRQFTDEHRAAIEWLNTRTRKKVAFYGVEVGVIKIEESLCTPVFHLAARPNSWSKQTKRPDLGNERWRQFFQPLIDKLREHGLANSKWISRQWVVVPWKFPRIKYCLWMPGARAQRVEVYLEVRANQKNDERILSSLESAKSNIEAKLKAELEWNYSSRQVTLRGQEASIDDPPEKLNEIKEWMLEHLLKLKQVFDPRLEEIVRQSPPEEG